MKFTVFTMLVGLAYGLTAQPIDVDSINFYDKSIFEQKIVRKANDQLDFIQYKQINGKLKKIDYYDSKQRIKKDKIWYKELIKETDYTYFEKGQIIKRYDVLNQTSLSPQLNVHIKYPAMARENEIEGTVEVVLTYNNDCIPTSYETQNNLGHGIDEEVEEKMKLMIELSQKFNVPFEDCQKTNENFKIHFKLD